MSRVRPPYLRIVRAPGEVGSKRLAHWGQVVAVGPDNTEVDLSSVVGETEIVLKAGSVEIVRLTVYAFAVDDPERVEL